MKPNAISDIWKYVSALEEGECWPYLGGRFGNGYGRFNMKNTSYGAHAIAYEVSSGPIPNGMVVMHKCNNKICCNPNHLVAGTILENTQHASASRAFPVGITGIHGVSFDKARSYWTAQGYLKGKKFNLYNGPHKEKAIAARKKWECEHKIVFKEQTMKEEVIEFVAPYSAQGDVSIFSIDSIPSGLKDAERRQDGRYTLAHSETGHCHVIDGNTVRMYEQDDFISYLDVQKKSNVIHLRGFDTHKPISLPPGKYRIARQREYIPEGYRKAQD